MVQGNATLVVDLGNSSTKGKVLFGKDSQTGKYRERTFELSNSFAPIAKDYVVSNDYSEATSTILHVDAELNGDPIRGYYCNGELQQREFPRQAIKPSAIEKKYNLESTILSYRLAFLFAYKAILNMQRISDYNQTDITWNVVTLLPPGDLDKGKALMIDIVKSIESLDCIYPEVKIPIKIDKVAVLPEGYCAYAGVVYDIGRQFRKGYDDLMHESVLVMDIGAGTTDILMIKDNKLVQNSKYTITQGCNNVYQIVRRKLRADNIKIDSDVVQNSVISGKVKDGAKEIDISADVNEAKETVADVIISEVQDFFDVTGINARSISHVLICGGGSMVSKSAPDIVALSEKVIKSFKKLSPNSELVIIPNHIVTKESEEGEYIKVEEQISPRELNLLGASILAELV